MGYVSFHALLPSEDRLVGVTNNTVDIHNICPWSSFLERPLCSSEFDTSNFSSEVSGIIGSCLPPPPPPPPSPFHSTPCC